MPPIIIGPAGMDPILGEMRTINTRGGTASGNYTFNSAEFTVGAAGLVSLNQVPSSKLDTTMDVVNVTGTSVTLQPNTAYKIYAIMQAITLNANPPAAGKWAYEGHIELFVAGTGYVVTGTNVVLANALEPDSVNNCTVRFHNGFAIISVEDHVAGYIVVNGSTSGEGSLYYGITTSTNDYVAFDASLNGQTIPLAGAVAEGEKHVVGNGYTETVISGGITCTSKTTFSNLTMLNVTNSGGTMTLGDTYIPSGSTVAVNGGDLAIEKVTGNGGVINLGGTNVTVSSGITASIAGCTVTSGYFGTTGGAFRVPGTLNLASCTVTGNAADSTQTGGAISIGNGGTAIMTDCIVSGNSGNLGRDLYVAGSATISGGSVANIVVASTGLVQIGGNVSVNKIEPNSAGVTGGSVTLTSGAILDLTGNTNATPIAPGGGITFEPGGATVYPSAGQASAYMLGGMTVPTIGNTNVVNLNSSNVVISSGGTAYASGCTITGGGGGTTLNGGAFHVSRGATLNLNSVDLTGNGGNQGGAFYIVGTVKMSSSIVSGNTPSNVGKGAFVLTELDMTDCSFADQIFLRGGTASVIMRGSNTFDGYFAYDSGGGAVTLASGAILDLTGNTNATPINPGGSVIVNGSCQVITSAGTTVSIAGGTYTKINNDGTTN